ncbi:MAG: BamA/TamA family outer membrane protein [Pseudomonadota bacterium]
MKKALVLRVLAMLLALAPALAPAGIKVEITGVEGDLRANVVTFLSVERSRERKDIDKEMMTGLFNRIDREVRSALRPFGFYEPVVKADFFGDEQEWRVKIDIEPGTPVMITTVSVQVQGPGADDAAFDSAKHQTSLRPDTRLNHGVYEQVKGNLERTAASNGYLRARLVRNEMRVDVAAKTAQIDLLLDTGPHYRFGAINIEQAVIRPELVKRFLRFHEGDPYSSTELLRTQFALDDSLYFSTVEVTPGDPDPVNLTVPVTITATKSTRQFTIAGGYGTDTSVRGTLGWTDSRVNDRGHRLRVELTASAIKQRLDARYDIPIGDPALEKFSIEALIDDEKSGDLDTREYSVQPSITKVRGRWQYVYSVAATSTTTLKGAEESTSNLLVPGITLASVPEGFLGEALFSRTLLIELIGSTKTLGSDSDFVRLHVQSERVFDIADRWHLLTRAEMGAALVNNFDDLPGIYRFFAGGDRSVRGFGYNSLSPEEPVLQDNGTTRLEKTGGRYLLAGTVEFVRDLPHDLAAAVFFDVGNAFNNLGDPMEYSVGVGLRYRLPVVTLGMDIAQPLSSSGGPRLHLNISPKL